MDKIGALPQAQRAGFRPRSLDAVNFLLADVRGALGPYLNVFLITQQHWSQTEVGWVTTISGLLGLARRRRPAPPSTRPGASAGPSCWR